MIDLKWKPKHGQVVIKSIIRKFIMDTEKKSMDLDFVISACHKKFHFHAHTDYYDDEWKITCSKKNFSWNRKRWDVVGYHIGYGGEDDVAYISSIYWNGSPTTPIIQAFLQIFELYGWFWFDFFEIRDKNECLERYWRDLDNPTFLKYEPNEFSWVYNGKFD